MSDKRFLLLLLIFVGGLWLVIKGIQALRGYNRKAYFSQQTNRYAGLPPDAVYAEIPMGLVILSWLPLFFLVQDGKGLGEIATWIFNIITWGGITLSIVLMTLKPRWLKPWWLKWLEDNYSHVLPYMVQEIKVGGFKNFEQQTPNEAALAAWADNLAAKYGWQKRPL